MPDTEPPEDELWEASPFRPDNPAHKEMVEAIGRLAISSAQAEATLRNAIYSTYMFGDSITLFTEGESPTWLLEKIRVITRDQPNSHEAVVKECAKAKLLFEQRNRFIHSEINVTPGGQYVTFISKRHRELQPRSCSVNEILLLAQALLDVSFEIHSMVSYQANHQSD